MSKHSYSWRNLVLTLLLTVSILSVMVSIASDIRLGRERITTSTPDGLSKRPATCIIVSTKTGITLSVFSCVPLGGRLSSIVFVLFAGLCKCARVPHLPGASILCWGRPGWPDSPSWRWCSSWCRVWPRPCRGSVGSTSSSSGLACTPGSAGPGVNHRRQSTYMSGHVLMTCSSTRPWKSPKLFFITFPPLVIQHQMFICQFPWKPFCKISLFVPRHEKTETFIHVSSVPHPLPFSLLSHKAVLPGKGLRAWKVKLG